MTKLNVVFDVKSKLPVPIDLDEIIKSRALFQANSGGGKSYLLRSFLEQSHGHVQQIIIDPEGEFPTLRELPDNDYLLVSKDANADIQLSIKYAPLLAKKLMETGANAIIDLYEMSPFDRIRFVKVFLDALVNLPKNLWHACLVIIDEIHTFAPESSKGRSESLEAVASLASRGRKRGYALIGATQKLSKFHKDVAAELNTKFTGRCVLDIDQKRAAAELGLSDYRSLRNLDHEFWAFGSAISGEPILVKSMSVKTTHEDIGSTTSFKIANQGKINNLRKNFQDLPQEAEEELKTLDEHKKKIQDLQIQLRTAARSQMVDPQALEKSYQKGKQDGTKESKETIMALEKYIKSVKMGVSKIKQAITELPAKTDREFMLILETAPNIKVINPITIYSNQKLQTITEPPRPPSNGNQSNGDGKPLRDGAMRMLKVASMYYPDRVSKNRIATLAGFSVNGGTFTTYLSELKRLEWITISGEDVTVTQEGINNVGNIEQMPTDNESLLAMWSSKFRNGAAKMLREIVNSGQSGITKSDLADRTGFTASGGTFTTYLSELKRNYLIEINGEIVSPSREWN